MALLVVVKRLRPPRVNGICYMNKFSALAGYKFGDSQKKLSLFLSGAADFCHFDGPGHSICGHGHKA